MLSLHTAWLTVMPAYHKLLKQLLKDATAHVLMPASLLTALIVGVSTWLGAQVTPGALVSTASFALLYATLIQAHHLIKRDLLLSVGDTVLVSASYMVLAFTILASASFMFAAFESYQPTERDVAYLVYIAMWPGALFVMLFRTLGLALQSYAGRFDRSASYGGVSQMYRELGD